MAFNAEQINIILSAQTKDLRDQLSKAEKRMKYFENKAKQNLSGTSKGFDMLGTAAKRLAPILAAAFSVRAIQNAANYAQELRSLSALSGVAASDLQALGAASLTVVIST